MATELAPYDVRVPAWLPDGFVLVYAEWLETPDAGQARGSFSVDLQFASPLGVRVHIWQTNIPEAELIASGKDPVTSVDGTSVEIAPTGLEASQTWILGAVDFGTPVPILSTRLDDGITISIDGPVDLDDLRRVAESLLPPAAP